MIFLMPVRIPEALVVLAQVICGMIWKSLSSSTADPSFLLLCVVHVFKMAEWQCVYVSLCLNTPNLECYFSFLHYHCPVLFDEKGPKR